jgi:hypothetical protein
MKIRHLVLSALSGYWIVVYSPIAAANVISDMYSGGNGTYTNVANVTVTGVLSTYGNGAETFVGADSTGSVLFFDNLLHFSTGALYSPTAGDHFFITTLTNAGFENSPEISGFNFTNFSHLSPPTIPVLDVATMNAAGNGTRGVPPNSEAIVTLDDVMLPAGTTSLAAKTGYTITDSTGSGILFTSTSDTDVAAAVTAANAAEVTSGGALYSNPVNITGYIDPFFGVSNLYPLSITPASVPEPGSVATLAIATVALVNRRRKP